MSKVFEIIEVVGISTESISDAVRKAIEEINGKKQVSWFNICEERGRVTPEGTVEFQVTLKIGCKLNGQ